MSFLCIIDGVGWQLGQAVATAVVWNTKKPVRTAPAFSQNIKFPISGNSLLITYDKLGHPTHDPRRGDVPREQRRCMPLLPLQEKTPREETR